MSFFEVPKLENITKIREFPNICTDLISSSPLKNEGLSWLHRFLEKYYFRINNSMNVSEHSFKSHMHIPPYCNNDTGYFRFYDSESDRTIIVVPQRGGVIGYSLARLLASYLASNGFNVCEIVTPFHEKRLPDGVKSVVELPVNVETIKLTSKQAVEEILGLIGIIGQERIGIAGISQGAYYASMVSAIDSRIKSNALIHGFGDLANLLLYSGDRFAIHFREEMKKYGSIDELLLKEQLKDVEPLTYAREDSSGNTIMINAKWDKSLSEDNIRRLWENLGQPEIYWFYSGHGSTAIHSKKILKILLEYFQRTL